VPSLIRPSSASHGHPTPGDAKLYDYLVGGLERELIEQVIRRATGQGEGRRPARNHRNTLHKS